MSNYKSPSRSYTSMMKKYIARFEQATNPRTRNHIAGLILKLTLRRKRGVVLD